LSATGYLLWHQALKDAFIGSATIAQEAKITYHEYGSWLTFPPTNIEAPKIMLKVEKEWITFAISYETPEGLNRLRNVLNMQGNRASTKLLAQLNKLDSRFKTKLFKRIEIQTNIAYTEVKSFISNKLDTTLLKSLIIDAEAIKQEGLRMRKNTQEKLTPSFSLVYLSFESNLPNYANFLTAMKPIYDLTLNLRENAAMPIPKIDKANVEASTYRMFVGLLNEARKKNLISAEKRRAMDKRWRDEAESRLVLTEELNQLIKP
jgi:hypothetical protein